MKRTFWLSILSLVLPGMLLSNSTSPDIDSLQQQLQQAEGDYAKAATLEALINASWSSNREMAKAYLEDLAQLAGQLKEDSISAFVVKQQGLATYQSGDYEGAREAFEQASQLYESAGLINSGLMCRARAGIMHSLRGAFDQAEEVYRPTLQRAREEAVPDAEVFLLSQMGTLFHYKGTFDSAQHYYQAAIEHYRENGDSLSMFRPMYNLAVLQVDMGKYENSLETYTAIYNYQMSQQAYEDVMITLDGMSGVNRQLGHFNDAADNLMEAYRLSEQLGDARMKIHALLGMAIIEGEQRKYDQCKAYLEEALELSLAIDNIDQILTSYLRLGQLYHNLEQYGPAADYLQKGLALQDTLETDRYAVTFLLQLGEVYADAGQLDLADKMAQRLSTYATSYFEEKQFYGYLRLQGLISEARGDHSGVVSSLSQSYEYYLQQRIYDQARLNAYSLVAAHKALGQPENALQYAEDIHWLSDSLHQNRDVEQLAEQRKDFEFQLEKQKMEVERAKEAAILQAKARQNLIVAIGGIALALLAFGFFWNTRRKNQVIALKNSQLQQLNETKDRLFAIIGHDLRKPAIAFRGITQKVNYLLRKKDFFTLEKLGEEIEQDAAGLSQLTENLLNWALTQRNVMPYQPTKLKLLPLMEDTVAPFRTVLDNKQLKLQWDIPAGTVVYSDANALSTIVRNLLDNAIKFTPEGGTISLRASTEADTIKLDIRDTGVGIPQDKLQDLFLLKGGRTEMGTAGEKGSGLGLHLVYELSKLNKTLLNVRSQPGQGTIFSLDLPVSTI